MSESKSSAASGGIGFTGLLAVAFIVLKLCKVIDWSWWWVLSPIWIPIGVGLAFLLFAIACYLAIIVFKPAKGNGKTYRPP